MTTFASAPTSPLALNGATPFHVSRQRQHAPHHHNSHHFPISKPLRPFAGINQRTKSNPNPVKIITPPANHIGQFVLNMTQAELGRQDSE